MTILRWILFIPAGMLAGVIASALFRMGAFMFPDIVGLLVSGAGGAAGMIMTGLYVAPKKSAIVKWTMISLAFILGVLSAAGSLLAGDDKLQAAIGISMVLVALGSSAIPANELIEQSNK